ncbi:hypothetical protein BST61_g11257 [Cercospora zeina]
MTNTDEDSDDVTDPSKMPESSNGSVDSSLSAITRQTTLSSSSTPAVKADLEPITPITKHEGNDEDASEATKKPEVSPGSRGTTETRSSSDRSERPRVSRNELRALFDLLGDDTGRDFAIALIKEHGTVINACLSQRDDQNLVEELDKRAEEVIRDQLKDVSALVETLQATEKSLRLFREEDDCTIPEDESDTESDGKRGDNELKTPRQILKHKTRTVNCKE